MSFALDAIIIFSAIVIIWAAARRGFIHSVMNIISTFASMIVAYVFTPKLGDLINEKILLNKVADDIHATLRSLSLNPDTGFFDLGNLAEAVPQPLVDILDRYHVELNSFLEKISGLTGCSEETVYGFAEEIAFPTAHVISLVIAFLLLFLVSAFVIKGITELLDYIFQLPSLKGGNTVLGIVFGVVEAAVVACVIALTLSVLAETLGSISPDMFGADVVDKTLICKHLDNIGIFSKIREVIS